MIRVAKHQDELQKVFRLRYEVLRQPWEQPFESSFDELDNVSTNAYIEINGICVACGRLDILDNHVAQVRYMAVHPDYRGKHLGEKILQFLEDTAKKQSVNKIILHARENAVSFYLKNGYIVIKPSHVLFNSIQHYLMEKIL